MGGAAAPAGEAAWLEARGPWVSQQWSALWSAAVAGVAPSGSGAGKGEGEEEGLEDYPRVGVAISGGGLRAALTSAGVLSALDGRVAQSGPASGLWQTMSLSTGISGGGWALAAAAADPRRSWEEVADGWLEGMAAGMVMPGDGTLQSTLGFWQESLKHLHQRPMGAPSPATSDFIAPGLASALGMSPETGASPLVSAGPTDSSTWEQPLPILIVNAIGEAGVKSGDDSCALGSGQDLWELGVWDSGAFSPEFWGFGPTNASVLQGSSLGVRDAPGWYPKDETAGTERSEKQDDEEEEEEEEDMCWGFVPSLPWQVAAGGGGSGRAASSSLTSRAH